MPLSAVKTFPTERVLLVEARRGNAAALGVLYEEHGGALLRLGTRICGSASDGEDLLHDLFVGLPELLSRYEDRGALGAWLRGVIARMAIARLRLARRRDALAPAATHEALVRSDPWNAVDLERAIGALPESMRTVFVLRQIEGHTHDEIAALLGISSGASRVRYVRALEHLRALLERS